MTFYWIIMIMMAAGLVHYFNTLERSSRLVLATVEVHDAGIFD